MVALVLLLVAGLTGCKSLSEKIGEEAAEEIAGGAIGGDVEVSGDSVTIETDEGQTTIEGGSESLPDGFPADFPIPDDAVVGTSSSVTSEDDVNYYVNLTIDGTVDDAYAWYKAELLDAGWEIKGDVRVSEGSSDSALLSVEKGRTEATVNLLGGGGGLDIGIVLVVEGS